MEHLFDTTVIDATIKFLCAIVFIGCGYVVSQLFRDEPLDWDNDANQG